MDAAAAAVARRLPACLEDMLHGLPRVHVPALPPPLPPLPASVASNQAMALVLLPQGLPAAGRARLGRHTVPPGGGDGDPLGLPLAGGWTCRFFLGF
jgi:hypothetical protein